MIKKYGVQKGAEKYNNWKNDFCKNNYSEESVEFLNPIYDFLIQNGFSDEDIYWKINEFKIDRNFYDFTVPKLNLIIEYHVCLAL